MYLLNCSKTGTHMKKKTWSVGAHGTAEVFHMAVVLVTPSTATVFCVFVWVYCVWHLAVLRCFLRL